MGRKTTDYIVLCSTGTPENLNLTVTDILRYSLIKGWLDHMYHFIITRDGSIEPGRNMELGGGHTKGYNQTSVAVCLVGGVDRQGEPCDNYTREQKKALVELVDRLKKHYPGAKVVNQRDLSSLSVAPGYDAAAEVEKKREERVDEVRKDSGNSTVYSP